MGKCNDGTEIDCPGNMAVCGITGAVPMFEATQKLCSAPVTTCTCEHYGDESEQLWANLGNWGNSGNDISCDNGQTMSCANNQVCAKDSDWSDDNPFAISY